MSIRLMNLAWQAKLTSTQKLVLIAMADWSNDEGICWPSIAKLASKTSLSERGLRKVIRNLEQLGHINTQEKPGNGNLYQLTLDPGTTFPPPLNEVPPTPEPRSSNTFIDTPMIQPSLGSGARKHMLPSDWDVGDEEINWALMKFPALSKSEIDNETDRFRDYWIAEGKPKADWRATWRNWIRRSVEFTNAKTKRNTGRTSDNHRRLSEALNESGIRTDGVQGTGAGQKYIVGPN